MSIRKNAYISIGAQVIGGGIALTAMPVLLSHLGADKLGSLGALWLFMTYVVFLDLGTSRALTRTVAAQQDTKLRADYFISAIVGSIIVTTIITGIILFAREHGIGIIIINEISPIFIYLTIIGCMFTSLCLAYLMAINRFDMVAFATVAITILLYIPPIVAIDNGNADTQELFLTVVLSRFIFSILLLSFCVFKFGAGKFKFYYFYTIVKMGFWIGLASMATVALSASDRFLILTVVGPAMLGIYTVVHAPISRLSFVPNAFSNAVFPHVASSKGTCISLNKYYADIITLLFPVIAILIASSNWLFPLWLGDGSAPEMKYFLFFLLLTIVAQSFAQVSTVYLQAIGRQKLVALVQYIELPILALLVLLLIDYGIIGILLALALRGLIDAVILMHFSKTDSRGWLLFITVLSSLSFLKLIDILQPTSQVNQVALMFAALSIIATLEWILVKYYESGVTRIIRLAYQAIK